MINAPTWWADVQGLPGTQMNLHLTIDGHEYGNTDLMTGDCKVTRAIYPEYGIGNATIGKLTATLINPAPIGGGLRSCNLDLSLTGPSIPAPGTWASVATKKWHQMSTTKWGGQNTTERIPIGRFWLNKVEAKHDGTVKIEALDTMALLDRDAYDGGQPSQSETWPKSGAAMVSYVCSRVGIPAPSDTSKYKDVVVPCPPFAASCRSILQSIGAAVGGNWIFDNSGKLKFIALANISSATVRGSFTCSSLTETSKEATVTGVLLKSDGGEEFSAGATTGLVLDAECDFATQDAATACLATVNSKKYHGYKATGVQVTPLIELGDALSVAVSNEVVICDSYSLLFEQGAWGEIAAPLKDEVEQRIKFRSASERKALSGGVTRRIMEEDKVLTQEDMADVQELYDELSGASQRIHDALANMDEDIAAARDELDTLAADISDAGDRIDGAIAAQNSKIDDIQSDLSAYKSDTDTTVQSIRTSVNDNTQWRENFTNVYMNPEEPDTQLVTTHALNVTADELSDTIETAYQTGASKAKIFQTQPTPPYAVDDLWVNAAKAERLSLWGAVSEYKWVDMAGVAWNSVNALREGIYVCITPKAEGAAFSRDDWKEADTYAHKNELALLESNVADIYTTKSEFVKTDSEIRASVSDSLTQAKSYADGAIAVEVTNRNSAIDITAAQILQTVSTDYLKVSTFDEEIVKYAEASSLELTSSAIIAAVSGTETIVNPKTGKNMTNQLAAGIRVTKSSIESIVEGNATYTAPDGTTKTSKIGSKVIQLENKITQEIEVGINKLNGEVSDRGRVFSDYPTPPYDVDDIWVNAVVPSTLKLWGAAATLTWKKIAEQTWGAVNIPREGIFVCIHGRKEGENFSQSDWQEASSYVKDTDLETIHGVLKDEMSSYTTKSEFEQTESSIRMSVNESLAEAKTYADGQIDAQYTNKSSQFYLTSEGMIGEAVKDYVKTDTLGNTLRSYTTKGELKVMNDAITATVGGAEKITVFDEQGNKKVVENKLSAGISVTQDTVTTLASGESTYTDINGTVRTNPIYSADAKAGQAISAANAADNKATAASNRVVTLEAWQTVAIDSIKSVVQGNETYKDPETGRTVTSQLASRSYVAQTIDAWSVSVSRAANAYYYCSTAGNVQEKTVTDNSAKVAAGKVVTVRFAHKNTAANPRFAINTADGKIASGPITLNASTVGVSDCWDDGQVVTLMYDGSSWVIIDGSTRAQIKATAENITLSVTNGEIGKTAQIKITAGGSQKVATLDLQDGVKSSNVRSAFKDDPTAIAITAGSVEFKSNTFSVDSTYFKVTKTGVITATSGTIGGFTIDANSIKNSVIELDSDGVDYYQTGDKLGKMGTNCLSEDNSVKGIVFDLDYKTGSPRYMAWAAKMNTSDTDYTLKLLYANRYFGRFRTDSLNLLAKTYIWDDLWVAYDGTSYRGQDCFLWVPVWDQSAGEWVDKRVRFARGLLIEK